MKRDYINTGNLLYLFVNTCTTTLYSVFLLSAGNNAYQAYVTIGGIIAMVLSSFFKNDKLLEKAFEKFPILMLFEATSNIIGAVLSLVFGTPVFAMVIGLLLKPVSGLQEMSVDRLTAKAFPDVDSRISHDKELRIKTPYIKLSAGLLGFFANMILSGPQAFALLCLADVINNVFFMKAYSVVNKKETVDVVTS